MSLRIESVIVSVLGRIARVVSQLKRRNRNLADELDRASSSILLNTSEGAYSFKGNQRARYHCALGSAAETRSCLLLAGAQHGVVVDPLVHDQLGRACGEGRRGGGWPVQPPRGTSPAPELRTLLVGRQPGLARRSIHAA